MHSLNQVNKLVSCGRDPARSLPLWRGFLLIPLILVCFAFAPQTRAVVPAPDGCYPNFNTAEGCQALQFIITGICKYRAWLAFALLHHGRRASILVSVLERWSSTARGMPTRPLALLPCYSMTRAAETQLLERPHWSLTTGDADRQWIVSTALLAPLRSRITTTGFSNNAVGDSALFRNVNGAANTAVGDLALENNDATGDGDANNNTAVGASALTNNVNGSENTGVGAGVGPNLANGFNNTYLGNFVGTDGRRRRRYDPHRRRLERERGRVLEPATSVVSGTTPSLLATTLL